MNSKRLYGLVPVVALVFAGCIISITELVKVDLKGNVTFTDGLVWETVDLEDYDVTVADINRIELVDLDGILRNDLAQGAKLDVYVSANPQYRTAAEVRNASDVLPVLLGYELPAGPGTVDTLTIPDARALSQLTGENWTKVKALLLTGKFTVYLTSSAANIQGAVIAANVYITLTAKP